MTTIRPLIVANWKMNGLRNAAAQYEEMRRGAEDEGLAGRIDLVVCPPATLLGHIVAGSGSAAAIALGAQTCHPAQSGAHTGDLSAEMLFEAGARWVVVGHSERRADHGETSDAVRAQVEAARRAGLRPIVCVGETLEERDGGGAVAAVRAQLAASAPDDAVDGLAVAYEPIWAIGTGRTPTLDDIAEMHHALQADLIARYGPAGAETRVLYGGSVKPANAHEILGLEPVGGALVGGASLAADSFLAIARAAFETA